MNKPQLLLTSILSTIFTLVITAGSMLIFSRTMAAPLIQMTPPPPPPVVTSTVTYLSVTSLAFAPVNADSRYQKDPRRQLLTLTGQPAGAPADSRLFIAPLVLPDDSMLTGLTIFGEDFDNQGAVQVRLKRCDHSQARCLSLAETTYAAGQFETPPAAIPNEIVNNYFYSYFLELELTAMPGSGLRSARLELVANPTPPTPVEAQRWALTGAVTNFLLPNQGLTLARVCADDLSYLETPPTTPAWLLTAG